MPSKEELVSAVKHVQRSDSDAKEDWWKMCDEDLGGIRDPNRHSEDVLCSFLEMHGGVEANVEAAVSNPVAMKTNNGSGTNKQHQWNKASWDDQDSWGNHQSYRSSNPAIVESSPHGPPCKNQGLIDMIKLGQRISPQWKNCWHAYCDVNHRTLYDPSKHEEMFIQNFVNQCAVAFGKVHGVHENYVPHNASSKDKGRDNRIQNHPQHPPEPPVKRPRCNDPQIDQLVAIIKQFQRSGEDNKDLWHKYCDATYNGVRDPARHTVDSLDSFIQAQNL